MKNRKVIAFVTPSLGFGGREKVLSLLINRFIEKDETIVHLILYGKNRQVKFYLNPKVIIHEPDFDYEEYISFISLLKTLFFVRKTIKKIGVDIMISFEEIWNRFALFATLGLRIKKAISNRNNPYSNYGIIDSMLAKLLYPTADILIAQTKIAKEVYSQKYSLKKCVVIGNPINLLDDVNSDIREKIIISVGRLMNSKNHLRLLNIFNKTDNKGWKLMIVGGDFAKHDIRSKLQEKINTLGLNDKVIMTGSVSNVNKLLLKSSIFAFASSREGFPNVIGEAMAAGLPIISYDCVAGPSEMIDDGYNGFLIPLFDDELYVAKLKQLMDYKEKRKEMGENSLNKIKEFDADKILDKFYRLIMFN